MEGIKQHNDYYTQKGKVSGLTKCQKALRDGEISISDVPFEYRNSDMYCAAYKNADTSERKEHIDATILQDIEANLKKWPGCDSPLIGVYMRYNPNAVKERPDLYFLSSQCHSSILEGKMRICDVPFQYRSRLHYRYAYLAIIYKDRPDTAVQEFDLLIHQLHLDILRCHQEGREDQEAYLRDAEQSIRYDFADSDVKWKANTHLGGAR